jgi:hypothetical protein
MNVTIGGSWRKLTSLLEDGLLVNPLPPKQGVEALLISTESLSDALAGA